MTKAFNAAAEAPMTMMSRRRRLPVRYAREGDVVVWLAFKSGPMQTANPS